MTMFLLFFSVFAHAEEIDQILFQKHSSNTAVHYEYNKYSVDLIQNSNEENKRYNPPLKLHTILFHITMDASRNLPAGKSLKATLNGKIIIQGDHKYKIKMKKVILGSKKYSRKELDCSSLFYVSPHMGRLIVELKDESGLASCSMEKTSDLDPTQIGKRDLGGDRGNFYTQNQDSVLGSSSAHQFITENSDTVLPSTHPTTIYAQGLMNRIAQASDNPSIQPNVHVINANVMNAFALPGGEVFVFRGLLDQSQNEAQLAGVLGHEWAHVTMRHGTKGMSRHLEIMLGAQVGSLLVGIFASNSKNETVRDLAPLMQYATMVAGQIAIMSYSKSYEREADKIGAQYAWNAGYPPYGLGQMFEVFTAQDPSGANHNFLENAFSSHPDHAERIASNYLYSGFYYPSFTNATITSVAYESAKTAMSGVAPMSDESTQSVMSSFKNTLTRHGEDSIKAMFPTLSK